MATKSKAKSSKKSNLKRDDNGRVTAGAGILFAAVAIILVANLQDRDNIKLLLVGFAACLLVFGGALLGMATKPAKK